MSSDESSVLQRAQSGDMNAFKQIYQDNQHTIYTYIYYRVGETHLAEDLTSDVFVRMIDKIDTFTNSSRPILAWLYTIARNLVIDHYRANRKAPLANLDEERKLETVDRDNETAEKTLNQIDLMRAMQEITEEQRAVIVLKFIEGNSNAEIAKILNKTEGAVKSLQHRALCSLKQALEGLENVEQTYGHNGSI